MSGYDEHDGHVQEQVVHRQQVAAAIKEAHAAGLRVGVAGVLYGSDPDRVHEYVAAVTAFERAVASVAVLSTEERCDC